MTYPDLTAVSEAVRIVLDDKYRVREIALTNSRKIIRLSANSIPNQTAGSRAALSTPFASGSTCRDWPSSMSP